MYYSKKEGSTSHLSVNLKYKLKEAVTVGSAKAAVDIVSANER